MSKKSLNINISQPIKTMLDTLADTVSLSQESFYSVCELTPAQREAIEKFSVFCINNFKILKTSVSLLDTINDMSHDIAGVSLDNMLADQAKLTELKS